MTTFGESFRAWRTERGWTQKGLSEALHIDQAEISKIENGRRRTVSVEMLDRICDLFEFSAEQRLEAMRIVAESGRPDVATAEEASAS